MPKTEAEGRLRGSAAAGLVIPVMVGLARRLARAARLTMRARDARLLLHLPKDRGTATVEIPTATLATPGLGDILVQQAGVFVRLAAGSDDQVLTADSGEDSGLKWAAAGGGGAASDTLRDLARKTRLMYWYAHVESKQFKGWNVDIQRTGTAVILWSDEGGVVEARSTTGGGAKCRWHLNGNNAQRFIHLEASPKVTWRIRTGADVDRALYWIGYSDKLLTNTSSGGTAKYCMFRFMVGVDTYWMASTSDGSSQTHTATTTTMVADTYYDLSIDYNNTTNTVTFAVNETDTVAVTTTLPAEDQLMGLDATGFNQTAGGAGTVIGASSCYLEIL